MNTKLWHIGIASALTATMGLAHAQNTPQTDPSSGAIINNSAQPASPSNPAGLPGVASDGVPGLSQDSSASSTNSPSVNSQDWNNSQDPTMSAPTSAGLTDAVPPDSLAGVDERRNQGLQSNDGMNLPPAFAPGSPEPRSHKHY